MCGVFTLQTVQVGNTIVLFFSDMNLIPRYKKLLYIEWFGFCSLENFESRLRNLINESELIEKKFFFGVQQI